MRNFFLMSCKPGIWVITILELVLIVLLSKKLKNAKNKSMVICMILIGVGLFIDALFISLGVLLPKEVILTVSPLRFIAHGSLIPLIFPICGYGLKLKEKPMKVIWAITIVVMILGLSEALATKLEIKEFANVLRAVSTSETPKWADKVSRVLSFGTVIPLMIAGVYIWVKEKHPQLFLSGFLMFAFAALGPATGNMDLIFYISMYGELLMLLFFYLDTNN